MSGKLPRFDIDEWSIGADGIDLESLAHEESVFGLSNGHVGWRGNLDEGDPRGVAGSYLNGLFEEHPMPYAEEGYGYPECGQSVINAANGQLIRLTVGDEPSTSVAEPSRRTSVDSTSAQERSNARPSGPVRPADGCGSGRRAWCPSRTAQSQRCSTVCRRSAVRRR